MFIEPNCWNGRLEIKLDKVPETKQSTRFRAFIDKATGRAKGYAYQSKKVKDEELSLVQAIEKQLPESWIIRDTPMMIGITYQYKLPDSAKAKYKTAIQNGHKVYKDTSPDLSDNLNKCLFDALQKCVITNDSKFYKIFRLEKIYGLEERTFVEIFY